MSKFDGAVMQLQCMLDADCIFIQFASLEVDKSFGTLSDSGHKSEYMKIGTDRGNTGNGNYENKCETSSEI